MAEYLQDDQSFSWASAEEILILLRTNNKGTDKTAHPRSRLSAFVTWCMYVTCYMSVEPV